MPNVDLFPPDACSNTTCSYNYTHIHIYTTHMKKILTSIQGEFFLWKNMVVINTQQITDRCNEREIDS